MGLMFLEPYNTIKTVEFKVLKLSKLTTGYFTMNDIKVFPYFSGLEASSDLKPVAKVD